jgi:hypothetical protein
MSNGLRIAIAIAGCSSVLLAITSPLPEGWFLAGNRPSEYNAGMESIQVSVSFAGGPAGDQSFGVQGALFLRSKEGITTTGFGTLMRQLDSAPYLGKRVRFSASVKTEGVKRHGIDAWAGLWMRIDEPGRVVTLDNMHDGGHDRAIRGTKDWKRYEVVLDVPEYASRVSFGILLAGSGAMWANDMKVEAVGPEVKVTAKPFRTMAR